MKETFKKKIIRLSEKTPPNKFAEIGKLIMENKARKLYYAIEGNVGFFITKLLRKIN
jgi:hypothetical protein